LRFSGQIARRRDRATHRFDYRVQAVKHAGAAKLVFGSDGPGCIRA
jgi:hypothetical protein